jgi:hypothetical protein
MALLMAEAPRQRPVISVVDRGDPHALVAISGKTTARRGARLEITREFLLFLGIGRAARIKA